MNLNLFDEIQAIKVINTHEHLWDEEYRLKNVGDFASLFWHYGVTTLEAAGMSAHESETLFSETAPFEDKWAVFEKYYPLCEQTSCMQSVEIAIKDIYGIDEISKDGMRELNERMKREIAPGFHREILCERGGIDYCMVNCFDSTAEGRLPARTTGDTELLRPDMFADDLIIPNIVGLLERLTGGDGSTLSGWTDVIDRYFETVLPGCCMIKIALAYSGKLDFNAEADFSECERQYAEHRDSPKTYEELYALRSYLFKNVARRALEYKKPLKFHTGIFASSYADTRSNTYDLVDFAIANPDQRVVAMHCAYPYCEDIIGAVRNIPNLYLDMAYVWTLGSYISADVIKHMATAAPVNKIMAFGGDYSLVENTYGNLKLAKRRLAAALSQMIDEQYINYKQAARYARYMLRESAEEMIS